MARPLSGKELAMKRRGAQQREDRNHDDDDGKRGTECIRFNITIMF